MLYIYILKSILAVSRFIVKYINIIITYTNKKVELSDKGYLSLVRSVYQPKGRYIELTYSNNYLLEQYKVLKELHKSLFSNDEFLKFGYQKVIIVMAVVGKQTFSFHHNILINNNTTFKQYYKQIKDHINDLHDDGYEINKVNYFKVLVWNVDHLANKNIKITKDATGSVGILSSHACTVGQIRKMSTNCISPTTKKDLRKKLFYTMDIETISINAGVQIPVMLTLAGRNIENGKYFLADHQLMQHNPDAAVAKLWGEFYEYLANISHECGSFTIYIHNLGGFDGIFIYKYLASVSNDVDAIIDSSNKFITISGSILTNGIHGKVNLEFKDSYRVFPVSLQDLCGIFNTQGKTNAYKDEYNKITLFNNELLLQEFISYGLQDSISLYNALIKAQELYHSKYQVDITSSIHELGCQH